MSVVSNFLGRLNNVVSCGKGWKASCPCHDDPRPSLKIGLGEGGRVLFYCHAGCDKKEILKTLGLTWPDLHPRVVVKPEPTVSMPTKPRLTPEQLDTVYGGILTSLVLSQEHREQLENRGLPSRSIDENGYKSLLGSVSVPDELIRDVDYLLDVPGVVKVPGLPLLFKTYPGLAIPIRNSEGLIQGIQVRTGLPIFKYYWPESTQSVLHVPLASFITEGDDEPLWVTEGALKADVTAAIRYDTNLAAVPSVSHWQKVLPALKQWRVKRVVTAFDMDWKVKEPVRKQLEQFESTLKRLGYRVYRAAWDEQVGKGLDDALHNGVVPTVSEVK